MVWPFIFSIANIFLAYIFTKLVTKNQNTALLAAILMAFFPTDIAFATINFSDSPAAFFINLGLFFLYKAHINNSLKFSLFSGLCFFISVQFKVNIFFVGLLLVLVWIYLVFKNKSINYFIPVALSFVGLNLLIEGMVYFYIYGDIFYRFRLIELNSLYNTNEFFVLGSSRGYASEAEFWPAVFKRVFLLNPKDVYLRRFFMFLPLISIYQSIRFIKQKRYTWLAFWFFGLSLLFIGFTSSFVRYQPIILRLSWYMFPLFLPQVIISAIFVSQFKTKLKTILMVIYILGSLLMSYYYTEYFGIKDLNSFKSFVRSNPEKVIYTDHFTKYSIDLLDEYSEPLRTQRILGETFELDRIKTGNWIVYNVDHINELKEQGHKFPDFSILHSQKYLKVFESGGFWIFEKMANASTSGCICLS